VKGNPTAKGATQRVSDAKNNHALVRSSPGTTNPEAGSFRVGTNEDQVHKSQLHFVTNLQKPTRPPY
jgi:hypothetical protein